MPRWFIRTGCGNQAYQAGGEGPRLVLHDGAGRAGSQPLSREEMRRTWAQALRVPQVPRAIESWDKR